MDELIDKMAEQMWQQESIRARGAGRLVKWSDELPQTQESWRGSAKAALQAIKDAGMVIVPRVATKAMLGAGGARNLRSAVYTAMIEAHEPQAD